MLVHDDRYAYYIASGIRAGARSGRLNLLSRLLVDRMIRSAHERGLTFDFEGSVVPGVEHFFRGWGGRLVVKFRAIKIIRPWTYAGWFLYRYWTRHRKTAWFEP